MKIYIQYMVSLRCKLLVKAELEKLGIRYLGVELGEVVLETLITEEQRQALAVALHRSGLELMEDKKAILIEKIIHMVVEMVHYTDDQPNVNFSVILGDTLHQNYHSLSELFSKTKGVTLEKFIILHKIERVKELLIYDELNITEIADKLHYSSVSHLTRQFKQQTGLTPSFFKNAVLRPRKNLDDLP